MPAGLIILSDRESIGRIRRDSGCRRLSGDGEVEFIAIDEVPSATEPLAFEERQRWTARLGAALGPAAPPLVLVWRHGAPGAGPSPASVIDHLRDFAGRALQSDRALVSIAAVVAIFPDAIGPEAATALEALAESHAVFLMNAHSRLLAGGPSFQTGDVWPVAVGRLVGSLRYRARRQRGLRAWRALSVVGQRGEDDPLDAVASKLARFVISGFDDDLSRGDARTGMEQGLETRPLDVPEDRVSVDGVPQHAFGASGATRRRPELVSWWELPPADGAVPVRGSARFEAGTRLDLRAGSRWRVAFAHRGSQFVRDRFARARSAALSILGPESVYARAWERIHRHPAFVPWHAKGAFFKRPSACVIESIAAQRMAWSRLRELDDRAAVASVKARVVAHELDEARASSPSVLVRAVCMLTAILFASSVVGVVVVSSGRNRGLVELQWSVITGLAACAGGLLTAGLLMFAEWRSGQTGRAIVESGIREAEGAIAEAFHARLELGAEGELLHRRTTWLQSAARVRETADRLHAVMVAQEGLFMRQLGERSSPGMKSVACVEFRQSMSVVLDPPITGEGIAISLRARDPELLSRLRGEFLQWWREHLRRLDPSFAGGIDSSEFACAYSAKLGSITEAVRIGLRAEFGRIPDIAWSRFEGRGIAHAFGPGDDVPGLSCVTHRARGMERHRVVFVHAPTESAARNVSREIVSALHGDAAPVPAPSDTDGWGGLIVVVDEVSVSLDPSRRGVDGGVLVLEGRPWPKLASGESPKERGHA